jgi:hypothetical protein
MIPIWKVTIGILQRDLIEVNWKLPWDMQINPIDSSGFHSIIKQYFVICSLL